MKTKSTKQVTTFKTPAVVTTDSLKNEIRGVERENEILERNVEELLAKLEGLRNDTTNYSEEREGQILAGVEQQRKYIKLNTSKLKGLYEQLYALR